MRVIHKREKGHKYKTQNKTNISTNGDMHRDRERDKDVLWIYVAYIWIYNRKRKWGVCAPWSMKQYTHNCCCTHMSLSVFPCKQTHFAHGRSTHITHVTRYSYYKFIQLFFCGDKLFQCQRLKSNTYFHTVCQCYDDACTSQQRVSYVCMRGDIVHAVHGVGAVTRTGGWLQPVNQRVETWKSFDCWHSWEVV